MDYVQLFAPLVIANCVNPLLNVIPVLMDLFSQQISKVVITAAESLDVIPAIAPLLVHPAQLVLLSSLALQPVQWFVLMAFTETPLKISALLVQPLNASPVTALADA